MSVIINLAQTLKDMGVKKVFVGLGERNRELYNQLIDGPIETFLGFEERSLAFMALGAAKVSQAPVAILVTSGTAVSECFPAVVEAYQSYLPLIVISADRPEEFRETRYPQTINQDQIFGQYARTYFEWKGSPVKIERNRWDFPLHINIPVDFEKINHHPKTTSQEALRFDSKSLIVINDDTAFQDIIFKENFKQLVLNAKIYIYQEVFSPYYKLKLKNELLYDEQVQKMIQDDQISEVISFGDTPNSSFWRRMRPQKVNCYFVNTDKNKTHGHGSSLSIQEFINQIKGKQTETYQEGNGAPTNRFTSKIASEDSAVLEILKKFPRAEASLIQHFIDRIDRPGNMLLIGNSMPIRYLKFFKPKYLKIFGNRGANGIDGLISTAMGIAMEHAHQEGEVHLLLGDYSFLYDLPAFFQAPSLGPKVTVIDNEGAKIFERLKIAHPMIAPRQSPLDKLATILSEMSHIEIDILKPDSSQTLEFWSEYDRIWR
jgi:2-succinyl-5-enolpyruvyl-6-hydroxy-3-cyclohexene-1-carboxylate synthase